MTDGLLIVIAVATGVAAIVQVGAVVFALRAAKQLGDNLQRIERDLQPVVANLRTVSADIARATSVAAAQVERAEQALADLSRSVDSAAATFQGYVRSPVTNGLAVLQGLRTAFDVLRGFRRPRTRPQPEPERARPRAQRAQPEGERDDDMFIG